MRTKVLKWGNSLGLRIPKAFAEDIRVADGTPVEMTMVDGQLIVRVAEDREWSLDGLAGRGQAGQPARGGRHGWAGRR
jgi:antitoxin MazE